jgi:hypothetical protein
MIIRKGMGGFAKIRENPWDKKSPEDCAKIVLEINQKDCNK